MALLVRIMVTVSLQLYEVKLGAVTNIAPTVRRAVTFISQIGRPIVRPPFTTGAESFNRILMFL